MRNNSIVMNSGIAFDTNTGCKNAAELVRSLSQRCREVLRCIVAGQTNKVIAYKLGISPRTVEVHRANMMRHLNARHVADAIRIAIEAGLDEEPVPDIRIAVIGRSIAGAPKAAPNSAS